MQMFYCKRMGLQWRILRIGRDGQLREVDPQLRCWRVGTALRIEAALTAAYRDGVFAGSAGGRGDRSDRVPGPWGMDHDGGDHPLDGTVSGWQFPQRRPVPVRRRMRG